MNNIIKTCVFSEIIKDSLKSYRKSSRKYLVTDIVGNMMIQMLCLRFYKNEKFLKVPLSTFKSKVTAL